MLEQYMGKWWDIKKILSSKKYFLQATPQLTFYLAQTLTLYLALYLTYILEFFLANVFGHVIWHSVYV